MEAPLSPLSSRVVAWACGPPKRMNITPKSLIDFKEFARDVRRSEAEGSAVHSTGLQSKWLVNNLIEWILDDPCCARTFKPGNYVAQHTLFQYCIHRCPARIAQRRDGWRIQGRQQSQHLLEVVLLHVHHQSHPALRRN